MNFEVLKKREAFFANNPIVYQQYCEIKKVNASADNTFTESAFESIKEYAIKHTRFYATYNISDMFPIMTKLDYIQHQDEILSDEVFCEPIHISSTSGSTGMPFSVKQDNYKRMRTIADLKVYGEYANYPSHEVMIQLRSYNGKELDQEVDKRENIFRFDISGLSNARLEELVKMIETLQPKTIFGYVSTLETICDYIISQPGYKKLPCGSVLVGAEMLTDTIAKKINKVFDCPIFDRYSNMEMGIYAQREYGKTNFIVNKASYYLEVVKTDSDEPADEHEVGRIVFTDLFNHAFPMIRYDTGDLGSFCYNENGNKEIEVVYGRRVDCVYSTKGTIIDPHIISTGMWGIEHILQWQFIQEDVSRYRLVITRSGKINEAELANRLQSILGEDAQFCFEYVQDIPVMNSQKRKYIMNRMNKQV